METYHAEGDSPFLVDKEASSGKVEDDNEYVECPVDGCGETILREEMEFHIELHAEEAELDDGSQVSPDVTKADVTAPGPSRSRSPQPGVSARQQNAIQTWRNILAMPSSKRQEVDKDKESVAKTPQGKRLGVRRNHLIWSTRHRCERLETNSCCVPLCREASLGSMLMRTPCLPGWFPSSRKEAK